MHKVLNRTNPESQHQELPPSSRSSVGPIDGQVAVKTHQIAKANPSSLEKEQSITKKTTKCRNCETEGIENPPRVERCDETL